MAVAQHRFEVLRGQGKSVPGGAVSTFQEAQEVAHGRDLRRAKGLAERWCEQEALQIGCPQARAHGMVMNLVKVELQRRVGLLNLAARWEERHRPSQWPCLQAALAARRRAQTQCSVRHHRCQCWRLLLRQPQHPLRQHHYYLPTEASLLPHATVAYACRTRPRHRRSTPSQGHGSCTPTRACPR